MDKRCWFCDYEASTLCTLCKKQICVDHTLIEVFDNPWLDEDPICPDCNNKLPLNKEDEQEEAEAT